jgi:hypothetical protein
MSIDKKILKEIERHHKINRYITEQETGAPTLDIPETPVGAPAAAETPAVSEVPATPVGPPEKLDLETDTEVEKIDDEGNKSESSEELEVTDLVRSQEKMEKKQDDYFNSLFGYIKNLESKLGEMDQLIDKLNTIETKIEKYREKTPQEKLELRSLDSGPFNQKLTDFFDDKKEDFEKSGKHEYILTSDEIEDINPSEIKKTFSPNPNDEKYKF